MLILKKEINCFLLFLFLFGCSGMEHSEQERLKQLNARGEFIHRKSDEHQYEIETPVQHKRALYPWEVTKKL